MSYVIKRLDQGGGYVTPPGSQRSYTQKLQDARKYATREDAERECCANEKVSKLEDELR